MSVALNRLNEFNRDGFVAVCGPFFEHSPWVAARTWPQRPFENLDALHAELCDVLDRGTIEEQLELIAAHPDLVGNLACQGQLTAESTSEQAAAGLDQLTPGDIAKFDAFNQSYQAKFGFPFVICARENKAQAILAAFPIRLKHSRMKEISSALDEVKKIARLRMIDAVKERSDE